MQEIKKGGAKPPSRNRTTITQLRIIVAALYYHAKKPLQVIFLTGFLTLSPFIPAMPTYASGTDCDVAISGSSGSIQNLALIKNLANQTVTYTYTNHQATNIKTISWNFVNGSTYGITGAASVTAPSGWTYQADTTHSGGWDNATGLANGASLTFSFKVTTDATTVVSDPVASNAYIWFDGWTSTLYNGTRVRCTNAANSVNVNNYASYTITTPAPPAPPSLTGSNGALQNVLNWTSCASATGYTLKNGTTTIYTGTATTYTHTGLTAGTSYAYTVTCTNSNGTSGDSNTVTLVPVSVTDLSQPTNLSVRDIQIISIVLTGFLSYHVIKPFRWRL